MARTPPAPPQPQWAQAPDGSWHPIMPPVAAPPAQVTVKNKSNPVAGVLACVLLGIIAVGVIGALGSPKKDPAAAAKEKSSLACTHVRNVAADASKGILSDAELRAKLQEVHRDAAIATPEVQKAATHMLAASTAANTADLQTAANEMAAACKAAGF